MASSAGNDDARVGVTVTFKRTPYYAHLLIAFDELTQQIRANRCFEDTTVNSILALPTIFSELVSIWTNDGALDERIKEDLSAEDIELVRNICKRIIDAR